MLTVLIGAIVKGITSAILRWWAAFRQGVKTQQLADAEATLKKEHEVSRAVEAIKAEPDRDFYLGDDGRVHRVRRERSPADLPGGPQPPAQ